MNAFKRAFEIEMQGAAEASWYDFLRWTRTQHYGTPANADALRREARERAEAGEIPPWPDFS